MHETGDYLGGPRLLVDAALECQPGLWVEIKDNTACFSKDTPAGIDMIESETSADIRYYNPQGIHVPAPEKGNMYIAISPDGIFKIIY